MNDKPPQKNAGNANDESEAMRLSKKHPDIATALAAAQDCMLWTAGVANHIEFAVRFTDDPTLASNAIEAFRKLFDAIALLEQKLAPISSELIREDGNLANIGGQEFVSYQMGVLKIARGFFENIWRLADHKGSMISKEPPHERRLDFDVIQQNWVDTCRKRGAQKYIPTVDSNLPVRIEVEAIRAMRKRDAEKENQKQFKNKSGDGDVRKLPDGEKPLALWKVLFEQQGNGKSDKQIARELDEEFGENTLANLITLRNRGKIKDWKPAKSD